MTEMSKSIFETTDIKDQNLGNIKIIGKDETAESPVSYTIPPDIGVIGVNAPKYDCCVQKVIDEMGRHIGSYNMQFVLGNDASPGDIVPYFPTYVMYFRSGTSPGTPDGILGMLAGFLAYYRGLGMPIYYYLDDYLVTMNNSAPLKLMMGSDGIIVATNKLKELLLNVHHVPVPIHVLKTHMDMVTYDMLKPLDTIADPKCFNILFSSQGRVGVQLFYEIVQRMNIHPEKYKNIRLISLSHQVAQIRSIINNCRGLNKAYVEWLPIELYYRLALACQLIIAPASVGDLDYMMPREMQQTWLDCKSAHKYTLAGATGIPCIASPIAAYKEAIKHEETGIVAETVEDWIKYIDTFINEPETTKKIGSAARKDVLDNWTLYRRTDELVSILTGKKATILTEATAMPSRERIEVQDTKPKNPKVMVFIPTHNEEKYIRECIDSVLAQDYPDQEIVLGDNGSTDNTVKIVREEYPMVKILQTDKYIETANPLYNQAIRETDAEFMMDLGGDDKMAPKFWETLLPYFSDEKVGFVRIGCYVFNEQTPGGVWSKPEPWINPIDILVKNKVHISSPMRCSVMKTIGDTDIECFFSDWDKWIRIVLAGYKWATCLKPMMWYRRHEKAALMTADMDIDGPAFTYMRDKWMTSIIKYGIKISTMAYPQHILEAKEKFKDVVTFDEIATREKQLDGIDMFKRTRVLPKVDVTPIKKGYTTKKLRTGVYIPVHNQEKYIRECLDSVMKQTVPVDEIIVGDNASTDKTCDIVRKEYPNVTLIKSSDIYVEKGNPGLSIAATISTADVLMDLGGDDKLCDTYWEEVLPYFMDNPEIGIIRLGCYQFSDEKPEGSVWLPQPLHKAEDLLASNCFMISSPARIACWRSIIGKPYYGFTGGYDTAQEFSDWDFWLQMVLLEGWKWKDLNKPLFWYRRHGSSETDKLQYGPALAAMRKKWMPYLLKYRVNGSMMASPADIDAYIKDPANKKVLEDMKR